MSKIVPRNLKFPFAEANLPKYWLNKSALASHMANSLNLLFPKGERFFIRSVQAYTSKIEDPELRAQMKAFAAQEYQHGREHEQFFEILTTQGFKLDGFLDWYQCRIIDASEKYLSPKLKLSATAAFEHFTATFAEIVLHQDSQYNDAVPPVMRDLFRWHACEEIEHKAVAFDVLQQVAPGYATRIAGLLLATSQLTLIWTCGLITLLKQDPEVSIRSLVNDFKRGLKENHFKYYPIGRTFLNYLKPGFHPNDSLNSEAINKEVEQTVNEIMNRYLTAS